VALTTGLIIAIALNSVVLPALALDHAALAERIDRVSRKIADRQVRTDEKTPWAILHAAVAFRSDTVVYDVGADEDVPAVEFLLTRAMYDGDPLFRIADGVPTLPRVPAVEHHVNQYLMVLALADVSPERELIAGNGEPYRVADLIEAAKLGYEDGQEVGWTLVALTKYLPVEAKWTAANRQTYTIEDLLARGIERDPLDEAEGGTHHLFGVAYAFRAHERRHDALQGTWREAGAYLHEHVQIVKGFQQDDGAFSDGLLAESKSAESSAALAFSTGHTLEWLTFALTPIELQAPWVVRAVERLCQEIEDHPPDVFSDGGIYHAINALHLYRDVALVD
jgi:hypothetical protein